MGKSQIGIDSREHFTKVSAKFYKAVVHSVILYGSKTWNLLTTTLAQLEGFHICAAYRMAEKHKPKKGPHHGWVYPRSCNVLKECSMAAILHYIEVRRATILCGRPANLCCVQGR
jgi:hypothetical protein